MVQIECNVNNDNNQTVEGYLDYVKDLHCTKVHRCSYTEYIQWLIDQLCHMHTSSQSTKKVLGYLSPLKRVKKAGENETTLQLPSNNIVPDDSYPTSDACVVDVTNTFSSSDQTSLKRVVANKTKCTPVLSGQLTPIMDINDPCKTTGYLAQESTDFRFVGPDRLPQSIDTVDQFVKVAEIIQSTGLPNYKMARIPVSSALNIQAWEHYLAEYPDKRVLQYLKFGFPLSLSDNHDLHDTDISNHASAMQHPKAVMEYLNKEMSVGAILGPVSNVPHEDYHCSPLLTRLKDTNKGRVILNLSHPPGASVNHFVNSNTFDNSCFTLKFPTIDNIVHEIKNCNENPHLIKIDVSHAFRNLRDDPKDGLNFGLKWKDSYFIDGAIAFGWVQAVRHFN